jgi:hypothetical protein
VLYRSEIRKYTVMLTVRIGEFMNEHIEKYARKNGISKSQAVRRYLQVGINVLESKDE